LTGSALVRGRRSSSMHFAMMRGRTSFYWHIEDERGKLINKWCINEGETTSPICSVSKEKGRDIVDMRCIDESERKLASERHARDEGNHVNITDVSTLITQTSLEIKTCVSEV
jgi:hypothetical protein